MSETIELGLGDDVTTVAERVASVLHAGDVAIVPTDTCYALVADAFQPEATAAVHRAKRRSDSHPLTVLIRTQRQVSGLVANVSDAAERLMASWWPGPLTIVMPVAEGLTWKLGGPSDIVSLRVPADDLLVTVIADVGPLVASAACHHGEAAPTTAAAAEEQVGHLARLVVDGGPREAPHSTIVDATADEVAVLRHGALSESQISQVAGATVGWGERPEHDDALAASEADATAPTVADEGEVES